MREKVFSSLYLNASGIRNEFKSLGLLVYGSWMGSQHEIQVWNYFATTLLARIEVEFSGNLKAVETLRLMDGKGKLWGIQWWWNNN